LFLLVDCFCLLSVSLFVKFNLVFSGFPGRSTKKTHPALPGPDAFLKKLAGQSFDRSAMRLSFQRMQTIQPWRNYHQRHQYE